MWSAKLATEVFWTSSANYSWLLRRTPKWLIWLLPWYIHTGYVAHKVHWEQNMHVVNIIKNTVQIKVLLNTFWNLCSQSCRALKLECHLEWDCTRQTAIDRFIPIVVRSLHAMVCHQVCSLVYAQCNTCKWKSVKVSLYNECKLKNKNKQTNKQTNKQKNGGSLGTRLL